MLFVTNRSKPYSVDAGRPEVAPAVAVHIAAGVHAQQRLVAVGLDVAQVVRSEQPHRLRAQPDLERVVPDDADVGLARGGRSRDRWPDRAGRAASWRRWSARARFGLRRGQPVDEQPAPVEVELPVESRWCPAAGSARSPCETPPSSKTRRTCGMSLLPAASRDSRRGRRHCRSARRAACPGANPTLVSVRLSKPASPRLDSSTSAEPPRSNANRPSVPSHRSA